MHFATFEWSYVLYEKDEMCDTFQEIKCKIHRNGRTGMNVMLMPLYEKAHFSTAVMTMPHCLKLVLPSL